MKIWIDILTPKQLVFSEAIIQKLCKKHEILCTSRSYNEVEKLAKIRNFDLVFVGKYGGKSKEAKLEAGIDRISKLFKKIKAFSPDITISFCSPEAARISFGLGIKHIALCDSPHADAVMRLTLPFIQKLLIPSIIPKKEFLKYGIEKKNIFSYKAIDAIVTSRRKVNSKKPLPFIKNNKKNILIRMDEEEASYVRKKSKIIPIVDQVIKNFSEENIVILGRYTKQVKHLKEVFDKKAIIVKMSFDGKHLLNKSDIFIGSGGTMTAESALMGIPTISYNAIPNIVEDFLVKKKMIKRETNAKKIIYHIKKVFKTTNNVNQRKLNKIIKEMEDPVEKLIQVIKL